MNYTALSLQQTPPLSVPLRFMITAPLFAMLAAGMMLYSGPELFLHRWQPQLLAVTHLLTLGFLAMVMFGAMFQLLPVLMGTLLLRPTLFSAITHSLLSLGILLLVLAWVANIPILFISASLFLGLSFAIFITFMGLSLLQSMSTHITRYMMLMALVALLATVSLGLWMLMGLGGLILVPIHQWVDLHLTGGLGGWVLLLVMGVSYQVIPMFQITQEYPNWHKRWIGTALFGTTLLLGLIPLITEQHSKYPLYHLLVGLALIYALTTMRLLKRRRRKLPDVTLRFWWLAMASLLLVSLLIIAPVDTVPHIGIATLFIVGFAMSSVNGMLYKIIPFLIWLHLNSHLQGSGRWQGNVPNMRQIISEHHSNRQFLLHLLSVVLLLPASSGLTISFYPAAIFLLFSQGYLLFNIIRAVQLFQQHKNSE